MYELIFKVRIILEHLFKIGINILYENLFWQSFINIKEFFMEDEQIKDIIVALINNKMFPEGKDEEHTAKYVARFIKTLEKELDK